MQVTSALHVRSPRWAGRAAVGLLALGAVIALAAELRAAQNDESADGGEALVTLEVAGFGRAADDGVAWHELDWDPSGERGLALPGEVAAREIGLADADPQPRRAELLPPADGEPGRAALLVHMDGATQPGQTRRFAVGPAADAAAAAAPADTGMRVSREENLLRIANPWYELTHDTERGGAIVSVEYQHSDLSFAAAMPDGFHRSSLIHDSAPEVTVHGGDGSLGVIVEVRARFVSRGGAREDGPAVIYRYRYEATSPLVRVEVVVPDQPEAIRRTNLRLLAFDFETSSLFDDTHELITASSGPGKGEIVPRAVSIGGDHRPRAGTLWTGEAGALAMIHPVMGDDFMHEWMGERQTLSATLYFGPADRVEDDLALAERVSAVASVSAWRGRIEAGLAAAERLDAPRAAVARTFFHAARQRMERVIEPTLIEHLLDEGEAVLAEAHDDAATATTSATAHRGTAHFIVLANAQTSLLFRRDGATLSLDGLYREGHGFIQPADFPRTLWHAWFIDDDTGERVWTASTRATRTTTEIEAHDDGGRTLAWRSAAAVGAGDGEVEVRGRVTLGADEALSRWSIDIQPAGERLGLWEVAFPVVSGVRAEPTNETVDYLATTGYLGRVPNPVAAGFHDGYQRHRIYRRGQYRAYYQDGAGLYLGAHDPELAPVGTLTRNTGGDGFEFSYLHPTEFMGQPGTGHTMAERMVVGTFAGHWYDAAQLYRAWLEEQSWFPSQPLHARPDVPEWAKQAVVSLRGGGESVVERHAELGQPPSVTWYYHGWHARDAETAEGHPSPKFAGTPDYPLPEGFERNVALPQGEGIHVGAYTLNTWWDYTAASWAEDDVEQAVVQLMGYDRPMYHERRGVGIVCQATDLWRDKQARVAANLAQTGVDGTYLDLGGGARLPFLCFSDEHGHPPGGGGFMAEGKRAALHSFREAAREHNPEFILISEGSAGYFLTAKDGFVEFVSSTPVAAALFFDYLRPLGNKRIIMSDGTHPLSSDPHNAITPAKHFAWGSSIGRFRGGEWHDRHWSSGVSRLRTRPDDLAYYRNLAWHKYVARPWLNLGRMLRPLAITDVDPAAPRELFADTFAPHAVWEAPDGTVALVFANGYHGREIAFQYAFDPADYGIAGDGSMALHRLTPAGEPPDVEPHYEQLERITGRVQRRETLAAGEVLILVAKPFSDPDAETPGADEADSEPDVPEPDIDALEL